MMNFFKNALEHQLNLILIITKANQILLGFWLACFLSNHHHLLAAVRKGEHKPTIVVDGDALYNCSESAVLPFGVEEVKLAKLKEDVI